MERMRTVSDLQALADSGGEIDGHPPLVRALVLTRRGDWDAAHQLASDEGGELGDWLHALLHVIEGDLGNAGYWYARCGRSGIQAGKEQEEWQRISEAVLAAG